MTATSIVRGLWRGMLVFFILNTIGLNPPNPQFWIVAAVLIVLMLLIELVADVIDTVIKENRATK